MAPGGSIQMRPVLTIWMKEDATGQTKFVTLLPDKL